MWPRGGALGWPRCTHYSCRSVRPYTPSLAPKRIKWVLANICFYRHIHAPKYREAHVGWDRQRRSEVRCHLDHWKWFLVSGSIFACDLFEGQALWDSFFPGHLTPPGPRSSPPPPPFRKSHNTHTHTQHQSRTTIYPTPLNLILHLSFCLFLSSSTLNIGALARPPPNNANNAHNNTHPVGLSHFAPAQPPPAFNLWPQWPRWRGYLAAITDPEYADTHGLLVRQWSRALALDRAVDTIALPHPEHCDHRRQTRQGRSWAY